MNRFQKWELCLGIYENRADINLQRQKKFDEYCKLKMNAKTTDDDKNEIMKDINRTYQEMGLFHLESNKNIMCNVLLLWCSHSLSYRQGMNEIVGVIFYTYVQSFQDSQEQNSTKIENDIYWVFKTIMDDGDHKQNFNYSSHMPIDRIPLIRYIKDLTMDKLKYIDEQLFQIFEQNQISTEIFLMKWIKIEQIQVIWDKMFEKFQTSKMKFLDAMIITMMIQLKPQLLKIEYINNFEVLLLFQNYPAKDNYLQMIGQAEKIEKQLRSLEGISWLEIIKRFNLGYSLSLYFQKN
ncbi:unnamed protein product [Paramecium pentaurelia]|uniref:Rab-GAP TBC domain-containing protein n=1 Tax=Paramecium pentaurelia TaxID=43138 RepID=A0A8S1V6T9_9CILI|nr:unnamed protein product [Paramecium pentaurelia]